MSAAMEAGSAGHAFLADWLINRDVARALAAFDRSATGLVPRPPSKPGWLSDSAIRQFHECPTKFYLSRLHLDERHDPIGGNPQRPGLERVYPPVSADTELKRIKESATAFAEARSACEWIASDPRNDGSDRLSTWGTELYMETVEPIRYRMFVDELAYMREADVLAVRDHKFSWKNDLRTLLRVQYGDQLKLYAATWNMLRRVAQQANADCNCHAPRVFPDPRYQWMADVPPIRYIIPNVIVVSKKGAHSVMPCEPMYFGEDEEQRMLLRLARDGRSVEAFTLQVQDGGWPFARSHMHPSSCVGFTVCPYAPACHQDVLDSDLYHPRPADQTAEPEPSEE